MPEAPWVRNCRHQNFDPSIGLKDTDSKLTGQEQVPSQAGAISNFSKYATFKKENFIQVDNDILNDLEDISDTDKVSLISDIELPNPLEFKPEEEKGEAKEANPTLNLKDLSEVKTNSQFKRVANGIKISKQKFICRQKARCDSCYRMPFTEDISIVANADKFMEKLVKPGVDKKAADLANHMPSTTFYDKNLAKYAAMYEDTVSDEEGSSSEDGEKKSQSKSYSHSRFSSNIDLDEMIGQGFDEVKIEALNKEDDKVLGNSQKEMLFNQVVGGIGPEKDVDRESLVITGSMSLNKIGPGGAKKKIKKAGGIGGTANLKKNKLAIAFNNIELEK